MFVFFSNFSSDGLRYNEFFKPARTFLFKTIILNNLKALAFYKYAASKNRRTRERIKDHKDHSRSTALLRVMLVDKLRIIKYTIYLEIMNKSYINEMRAVCRNCDTDY